MPDININLPGQPRRKRRPSKRTTGVGIVIAIAVALFTAWNQSQSKKHSSTSSGATAASPKQPQRHAQSPKPTAAPDCAATIQAALDARRSDVLVECSGDIIKVLDDDNDGARHQRFLVKLSNGIVVKVSHNIDLAPRVPAQKGDRLEFKGEFEWNDLGGVVHWTHHDPANRREGGWLRLNGETYE